MSVKYESARWTKRWRAVFDFLKLGVDPELVNELRAELRSLDLAVCGRYFELDEGDLPEHVWYAAIYPDASLRLQIRNGPSVAFPNVEAMLKYYPILEWIKDAQRADV